MVCDLCKNTSDTLQRVDYKNGTYFSVCQKCYSSYYEIYPKSEIPEEIARVYFNKSRKKLNFKIDFMFVGVWFSSFLILEIIQQTIKHFLTITFSDLILTSIAIFLATTFTVMFKTMLISKNESRENKTLIANTEKKEATIKHNNSDTEQRQRLKELMNTYKSLSETALNSIVKSSTVTEEREVAKYILEHRNKEKYCQKCGTEIVDGATFCHKCGEVLL